MKKLSIDAILNLKGDDFTKAWNSGQIQASALEELGAAEFEKDQDGNYIVNDEEE